MKYVTYNLGLPVIIGSIVVLPFLLLELINRRAFNEDFPLTLFTTLWLLPVIFLFILLPLIQKVRAGENIFANPFHLVLSGSLLILIAWIWVSTILDQMPCFLGVPLCD
jgi:uncharacterized membrane protein